jgi:hypothetical protein
MASIPMETGCCLELWRQAADVMLETIPDIGRTNKLIIIKLL